MVLKYDDDRPARDDGPVRDDGPARDDGWACRHRELSVHFYFLIFSAHFVVVQRMNLRCCKTSSCFVRKNSHVMSVYNIMS